MWSQLNRGPIAFLVIVLLVGLPVSVQTSRSLESSDIQPSTLATGELLWNASGCYLADLERSVEYDITVSHVSSVGVFVIRDPNGSVVKSYRWRNPPEGGGSMLFEPLSSGIYRVEIDGICHLQVFRYVSVQVGEDALTLRGFLDETSGVYGYYVWVWQSGAEHPTSLVEVEVKLEAPEGADFNLGYADRFFTEPVYTQDETLIFGNGPEGLLLLVQRVSGEGEYTLTVRPYKSFWKTLVHPTTIFVAGSSATVAILAIAVLLISPRKEKE